MLLNLKLENSQETVILYEKEREYLKKMIPFEDGRDSREE